MSRNKPFFKACSFHEGEADPKRPCGVGKELTKLSMITPAQIRGARGMLDWSMIDLARAAGVSVSTVKRIGDAQTVVLPGTLAMVQVALEAAGIEFLGDEENGRGMKLTTRHVRALSRFMR